MIELLRKYHRPVFFFLLIGWTIALLVPVPKIAVQAVGGETPAFWFAKLLHLSIYTIITIIGGALSLSKTNRTILLIVLLAHGPVTEVLQNFVERGASVRDAVIDMLGVLLGIAIGWRYRWGELFREPKPSPEPKEV
jgi:VanZ family protein